MKSHQPIIIGYLDKKFFVFILAYFIYSYTKKIGVTYLSSQLTLSTLPMLRIIVVLFSLVKKMQRINSKPIIV